MMTRPARLALILFVAACAGTGDRPAPHAEQTIDSVVPREEALRRFREGLPEVTAFSGGAPSRAALVQGVVTALERHDTTALRTFLVSKAEYAWLYYPSSAQGLPPYDLSPGLYWFMLEGRNQQGTSWLLTERAGTPLHLIGHDCGTGSTKEGENTLYGPCLVRRVVAPGDTAMERYFSQIVERGGKWKVLAYYGDQD